jgi:nucleoid-associated protein YgaU
MKKSLLIVSLVLFSFGTNGIADELEIKLVDESSKSKLVQTAPVEGCDDEKKKEHTCSKEEEEVILGQLPTSVQFTDHKEVVDLENKLRNVLSELSALKKEKTQNLQTIARLNSMIETLSSKQSDDSKKEIVESGIKEIIIETKRRRKRRPIAKDIKVIAEYSDHVIVEVQNGESLSKYAKKYYGDNNQYYRIYKANKKKIPKNLEIIIGSHLKIPLN